MKSIAFIIPYFGQFPIWIELYFETVKRNPTIHFHFFTNNKSDFDLPPNAIIHEIDFIRYLKYVNDYFDFNFSPADGYKLCDLRPLFGLIHQDLLKDYDFYGWTDMDILFGNIREFYTDEILSKYDVLSTHAHTISGHMALFRNNRKNRNMYRKIYQWREALQNPEFVGIDEHGITNAYLYTFWDKVRYKFGFKVPDFLNNTLKKWRQRKMYMVEQYTTPFVLRPWIDGSINSDQPSTWYYKNGEITNSRDGDRKFIYLHLMNFKSSKWRQGGTPAPWDGLENYVNAQPEDMLTGIRIDSEGISKIN